MDLDLETARVRRALRDLVEDSDLGQAAVEARAGLSRGYLGQVVRGHIELKVWQVLAIATALGHDLDRFFARLYGRPRPAPPAPPSPLPRDADALAVLAFAIEEARELDHRLAAVETRLEAVLDGRPPPGAGRYAGAARR